MELTTISLKRKKSGIAGLVGRSIAGIIGFFLLIAGALLMVTIIGILPGFGAGMTGLLMILAAFRNTQTVKCPHCKKAMNVQQNSEDFKCARCEKPTILEWTNA